MKHSDEFQRFELSFNSRDRSWLDDYDLEALSKLRSEERDLAVNMLIERLAENDARAPRAIAEIGVRKAIEPLRAGLSKFKGEMLVEAALALWKLEGFEGAAEHILRALNEEDDYDRLTAAYALRNFSSQQVVRALLSVAETDVDKDVRTTAATSLLMIHNVISSPFDSSQRNLLMLIDSEDIELKNEGIAELHKLIGKA